MRDAKISKLCQDFDVEVNSCSSHTLYNLDDILNRCPAGTPYPLTFTSFQGIVAQLDTPPLPCPAIDEQLVDGETNGISTSV